MDPEPIVTRDEISTKSDSNSPSDATSSPDSDVTQESTFHSVLLTQSPSIQVMERPEDFEFGNERIASSSVFTNRCSSSLEWSSVSDESLFSIGLSNSLKLDHACLLAGDSSGELMSSGDLMSFRANSSTMGGESDADSLKVETPSKLDVSKSSLDEPQKVVRWKTQVEHHADEVSFQGHQWQPSPLPNMKSSELENQAAAKPKKRFCWSLCDCSSCNLPKWSCWNSCWTSMSCSKTKPKKFVHPLLWKQMHPQVVLYLKLQKNRVAALDLVLPALAHGHVLAIAAEEENVDEDHKLAVLVLLMPDVNKNLIFFTSVSLKQLEVST